MNRKLGQMVLLASILDKNHMFKFSESIDNTLNEMYHLMASNRTIKSDCGCKSIKTARFSDPYEDENFLNLIKSIGSDEDLEDMQLHDLMYGEDLTNGNGTLEKQEMLKVLHLERENYQDMLLEAQMDGIDPSEEKMYQSISKRIDEIDEELRKLTASP
jgi:hypothetical protein